MGIYGFGTNFTVVHIWQILTWLGWLEKSGITF